MFWYEHLFGLFAMIVCFFILIIEMFCVIAICDDTDGELKKTVMSIETLRKTEQ